jgi:hypothetical protein
VVADWPLPYTSPNAPKKRGVLGAALLSMLPGHNEPILCETKQRGLAYLFKLRLTSHVKRMSQRLPSQREWTGACHGWQAKESLLRLTGWSR